MTLFSRLLPLSAALLLGAGCTTVAPVIPNTAAPAPQPPPEVEATPASVRGFEEPSAMLDNFTVHVAAVDGVAVATGRDGWNTPVSLKPGPRRLSLVFTRGVFSARAEVTLVAASGASYEARFATDAQLFGHNSFCEFWLIDAGTQAAVTPRVRMPLTRIEPPKDAP